MSDVLTEKKRYGAFLWAYETLANDGFSIDSYQHDLSLLANNDEIKELFPIEDMQPTESQVLSFNSAYAIAETLEFDKETYPTYFNTLKANMNRGSYLHMLNILAFHYSVCSLGRNKSIEDFLRSLEYSGPFPSDKYFAQFSK
jgi:hypothetical protein